ncbi:hypothetical protein GKD08_04085 [Paeniclostridium sordellii]|uniref:hypothetical protein n=1 Tax=Clostridia TaxID=186801 RepID=UPI0005DDEC28|nr:MULTISPECIES: hypothetical protein [Clostridia]MDU4415258.1 hypothetical protein [Paeniclostridium sordellii]MDU4477930.1 hypothetical protein [Clostridium sp.]MRZ27942.1 hypothetical protein [Paeniclostridium sordellii]CEN87334.1 Uncharacterised protein [[Clostridium] sordellii] [Paeniclostridium sordellii]
MSIMKNVRKTFVLALVGITISTPILGTVYAAEESINSSNIVQKQSTTDLDEISNYFGLTYKEKRQLSQAINDYKLETENTIQPRGKISWISKAVRKIWRKLPFKVRQTITAYVGLESFLNAIDHYTGTVENVIYKACKKVGMNNDVAWWVTKTITLFI